MVILGRQRYSKWPNITEGPILSCASAAMPKGISVPLLHDWSVAASMW